ncbi:MAG: thiamine phosphate synthase [Acidobacteriota bacterium]|nr:thiamine phosphate synthase [Acidobacteriota bacterium]
MRPAPDWRLYLVTDRKLLRGRPLEIVVESAVRGGVTAVQIREKDCPAREYIELARKLRGLLSGPGVPLLVNDRVDIALAAGADGVHLGQSDMPVREARRLMGPDALIGVSVENLEQAQEAEKEDVDYLGVSAIFATPTKKDTAAEWGLGGLERLRPLSRRTLVASGGLNDENAAAVIRAGADGIAVVSAVCAAGDPEKAARRLREIIDPELGRRRRTP